MKWKAILLVLWAGAAVAQQPVSNQRDASYGFSYQTSYRDVYCAGFISHERFNTARAIQGGAQSPEEINFTLHETVFLAGSGYEPGERYTVLRDARDMNRYEYLAGQNRRVDRLGRVYFELGEVRVERIVNGYAVARIENICQPMVPGDIVVPYHEKGNFTVEPRSTPYQIFGVPLERPHGSIVMSKDFDFFFGLHKVVYIDLGSNDGLKPGDYLRISRSYDPKLMPEGTRVTLLGARDYEDTQRDPITISPRAMKNWPIKGLGEMIVLSTTPHTATAFVTMALEDLQVGDLVSVESER